MLIDVGGREGGPDARPGGAPGTATERGPAGPAAGAGPEPNGMGPGELERAGALGGGGWPAGAGVPLSPA